MGVAVSGHARWLLATARQIRAATVLSTGWGEFLATDGTALEWEDAAGHGAEGRSGIRLQPNRLYQRAAEIGLLQQQYLERYAGEDVIAGFSTRLRRHRCF
ncbi:hypothetical protein BN873_720036 [Candidatus Competibacter denitrificans Run_A_D11]|uniref:Uncharacterized protein n=1 Tax=Candidatus Competibacter denitrificans Run_A_D11 TaxID=1400863 RepID=W6M8N0_9GAMM|nr:hypothetical protein BN873_720036 [Candidatus Competibacter denitrificans Run_A_D11]